MECGECEVEEEEEGRQPVMKKAPPRVSKAEREAHERTHTPFRTWCKYCMRGRGQNQHHRTNKEEEETGKVPRVSLDYMFMSQEDEKASKNPVILMKNEGTGELYARAVGQKGLAEDGTMHW